jgi:putative nucleotidyltransferase with HDIG domain
MFTRDEALGLLRKYTKNEHLIYHAYCVEAVMRRFATELGEDPEYWGLVGLLHDVDWDQFPEQHCHKAPELLREIGADDDFIHAVCSHGWGICSDVEPTKPMEKGAVHGGRTVRPDLRHGIDAPGAHGGHDTQVRSKRNGTARDSPPASTAI